MVMKRVQIILTIALACLFCAGTRSAAGQDDPARAQVAAATNNAIAALRTEILSARVAPTLTVGQFLDQTQSREELNQALQRCQQIGGPRWIDDQTVQVKLEISGTRVASTLVNIAAAFPHLSPMPAAELDQRLVDMKRRTFTGTGTSVSARRIEGIRPIGAGVSDVWAGVDDSVRVRTLAAAREDAARKLMDRIRPIELAPGRTVADTLANAAAEQRVSQWLVSRPVTKLRYTDDLEVELSMATPPAQVMETILDAARGVPGGEIHLDVEAEQRLRDEFAQRVSDATGRAKVDASPEPATRTIIGLPTRPPQWIWEPLDVEAVAPRAESPLRTKSAAEGRANESLRAKVGALRMDTSSTLNDLARQDARISDAIDRTLLRARVYKVEYRADGSVMVRMMIDPRDLWQDLRMAAE